MAEEHPPGHLLDMVETILLRAAIDAEVMTYQALAQRLNLQPPHTIHQTTELLEALMRRHAASASPILASLVISRARNGLPAPGFFLLLNELGLYDGPPHGEAARAFHETEKQKCFALGRMARSVH